MNQKWILLGASFMAMFIVSCSTPKKKQQDEKPSEPKEMVSEVPKVEVELQSETLKYATDDANMIGYIAYDKNKKGKRPGIIVVHEWWGHNDYARERADKLAELGYVAMAIDMYGDGKQAAHPDDANEFASMVMGNIDEGKARFEKALETLKKNPNVDSEKIGAIGYCFGGSVVLSMANAGLDLDAVAAFHSGLSLPIMPEKGDVKAKILVANGAEDPMVPAQAAQDFQNVMKSAGADLTYITYPNAKHAFTSKKADELGKKFNLPLAYNEKADKESWEAMKKLFKSVF